MTTQNKAISTWNRAGLSAALMALLCLAGCAESKKTEKTEKPEAAKSIPANPLRMKLVSFGVTPSPTGVLLCPVPVGIAKDESENPKRVPVVMEAYGNSPIEQLDVLLDKLIKSLKKMKKSTENAMIKLEFDENVPCRAMFTVIERSAAKGFGKDIAIEASHGELNVDPTYGPQIVGAIVVSSESAPKGKEALEVQLKSDDEGALSAITLNGEEIGSGSEAFAELHSRVKSNVSEADGANLVCVIKPDPELAFGHFIQAVSACRGTMDPMTYEFQSFIEQIHVVAP